MMSPDQMEGAAAESEMPKAPKQLFDQTEVKELPKEPAKEKEKAKPKIAKAEKLPRTQAKAVHKKKDLSLAPEEVGMSLFVMGPKHSKTFRKRARADYTAKRVKNKGEVLLPNGQPISQGVTLRVPISMELKGMLLDGIIIAGKAPKRASKVV